MSGVLEILSCSGLVTVQDAGRPGYLAAGLQPGGALDSLALAEGAALLGTPPEAAALECIGGALTLQSSVDTMIALTGAPSPARCEDRRLAWAATHRLEAGARLVVGPTKGCVYVHVAGGLRTPEVLGARAVHLAAHIGAALGPGAELPIADDIAPKPARCLDVANRFEGGVVRVVAGPQTALFSARQRADLETMTLRKDPRSNRTATRLDGAGEALHAPGGLSIVSDVITPGDIQITGDGTPFILMAECQTTGGYPRIASVIPADLPRVAQAPFGAPLSFRWVSLDEALRIERADRAAKRALPSRVAPLVRDPAELPDLLTRQLIGGVVSAFD